MKGLIVSLLLGASVTIPSRLWFTATGTGAVQIPFNTKFDEYASPKEFGAVCDGVVDDSTAVTRAIATGVPVLTPSTPCKTLGALGTIPAGSVIINGVRVVPGGTSPTGAASGDLGSTYPAPTVTATHLAAALPQAQGGTGAGALTCSAGNHLTSNGTVYSCSADTSGAPSGAAGGDLGSTYPNPTVTLTHLAAPLPEAQGGTGAAALTCTGTQHLTSNGTVYSCSADTGSGAQLNAANTWTGTPQTFTGSATRAPVNLIPLAAPSTPSNGDCWVETITNTFKCQINGVTTSGQMVSAKDFGAIGDGATSNNTAFAALATYANANPQSTIYFPDGTYTYSSGLTFTQPVTLTGGSRATLNYTGSAIAVKLGPDGLSSGTAHLDPYRIIGLRFTGGASMTQGIYFNSFIVNAVVKNTYFSNFGSAAGYSIFFQSDNWDCRVDGVHWWANDAAQRNFIRANGASVGAVNDFGQSQLTVTNTHANNLSTNAGEQVGIYWNGVNSTILGSTVAGFSPDLWIGGNAGVGSASFSKIDLVTMEVIRGANPCIRYGEVTGPYVGNYTSDITVMNSTCNPHNTDFLTTARFFAPGAATDGLQRSRFWNNNVDTMTAATPAVVMNNIGSQVDNWAQNNLLGDATPARPGVTNPLHTAGASISSWYGDDGNLGGDGAGYKWTPRGTTGCTTAATIGAVCSTTVTWTTAFPDANYTVQCQGIAVTSGVPVLGAVTSKLAASVAVNTTAVTAVAAKFTSIECTAVHD